MQVSYNGQQFTEDRIVHLKDPLASYEYYQDPLITFHSPSSGLASGGTEIRISGLGFKTFKPQPFADPENPQAPNRLWVKMTNVSNKKQILLQELTSAEFTNDAVDFKTPA